MGAAPRVHRQPADARQGHQAARGGGDDQGSFFTYTDEQWDAIKAVVQKALKPRCRPVVLESTSMDGTKHDVTLRSEIEGTARVHLARDKVMRSLPTQMAFRKR